MFTESWKKCLWFYKGIAISFYISWECKLVPKKFAILFRTIANKFAAPFEIPYNIAFIAYVHWF